VKKIIGQIQMSLVVVMSMAQVIPLKRDGIYQKEDLNQKTVKNKDIVLIQLSLLVMENIHQPQVSPLVKEDVDPAQVVTQGVGKNKHINLAQAMPQDLNNVDLICISHHTMAKRASTIVIVLVRGNLDSVQVIKKDSVNNKNMVLNQDGPQALKSISQNQTTLQAVTKTKQALTSTLYRENKASALVIGQETVEVQSMELTQISHLPLDTLGLSQNNLLPMVAKNLDLETLLVMNNMVLAQEILPGKQTMNPPQVSIQAVVETKTIALSQTNPLILEKKVLAVANLLVRNTMSPAQVIINKMSQESHQTVKRMNLHLVSLKA
jgi:hypothetical protein